MTVYFMLNGRGLVKIGYTGDLNMRMAALRGRFLGAVPGSREDEAAMHQRFGAYRRGWSEEFDPAPELLDFVAALPRWESPPPDPIVLDTRIDRHILFDADILDGLLAAAPRARTQLSGLVNKICEEWLARDRRDRRRREGGE